MVNFAGGFKQAANSVDKNSKKFTGTLAVASLGGAARPGCYHFGLTPYYDVKLQLHQFMVNTLLFSLCLVVPILIWTKNPIFRRRPFFSFFFGVFTYFWIENPPILQQRLFFSLDLFLAQKKVPPRNPAQGVTTFSNASEHWIIGNS